MRRLQDIDPYWTIQLTRMMDSLKQIGFLGDRQGTFVSCGNWVVEFSKRLRRPRTRLARSPMEFQTGHGPPVRLYELQRLVGPNCQVIFGRIREELFLLPNFMPELSRAKGH
jgi:hypothetical protein